MLEYSSSNDNYTDWYIPLYYNYAPAAANVEIWENFDIFKKLISVSVVELFSICD